PLFILHYTQLAIAQQLNRICKNRANFQPKSITISTIQSLASLSRQLNRLYSPPLALWLAIHLIKFFIAISLAEAGFGIDFLIYCTYMFTYCFYIIHCNVQSVIMLRRLLLSQNDRKFQSESKNSLILK